MVLSFKTKINGKPTLFIEKIWESLFNIQDKELGLYADFSKAYKEKFGQWWDELPDDKPIFPKLHTIRKDEKNRWKVGVMIDFFINARQKDMFRFGPKIPVVSIQEIKIKHSLGRVEVIIDDVWFGDAWHHGLSDIYEYCTDLETLAYNDGFESLEDFFAYFNEDYEGKILHWTDFKY